MQKWEGNIFSSFKLISAVCPKFKDFLTGNFLITNFLSSIPNSSLFPLYRTNISQNFNCKWNHTNLSSSSLDSLQCNGAPDGVVGDSVSELLLHDQCLLPPNVPKPFQGPCFTPGLDSWSCVVSDLPKPDNPSGCVAEFGITGDGSSGLL